MRLNAGERVEWQSYFSDYVFRGVIESFCKDKSVAFCTDQTGRRSRPVKASRLQRSGETHWYTGQAAG